MLQNSSVPLKVGRIFILILPMTLPQPFWWSLFVACLSFASKCLQSKSMRLSNCIWFEQPNLFLHLRPQLGVFEIQSGRNIWGSGTKNDAEYVPVRKCPCIKPNRKWLWRCYGRKTAKIIYDQRSVFISIEY